MSFITLHRLLFQRTLISSNTSTIFSTRSLLIQQRNGTDWAKFKKDKGFHPPPISLEPKIPKPVPTQFLVDKKPIRIAAGILLERPNVVVSEPEPWELEYDKMHEDTRKEKEDARYELFKERLEVAYSKFKVDKKGNPLNKEEQAPVKGQKKKVKGAAAEASQQKIKNEEDPDASDVIFNAEGIRERRIPEYPPLRVKPKWPVITPDDISDNRKSLYRKLRNHLYLIVKKPRKDFPWQFPQGGWEPKDTDHLRTTAERELIEELGPDLIHFFIGHAPLGCQEYSFTEEAQKKYNGAVGAKVFFYRVQYIRGEIKLNTNELEDYLWVTKAELKEYLHPQLYDLSQIMLKE